MSVDELRAQISQRLRSSAAFSKTVYQDQPIIMTGAQLKSVTPDPIREARQIAKSAYGKGDDVVSVFYQQARMLAGYEDDFEYSGTFSQYFPTYEDMSNEQLRGYFAWRSKIRQGDVQKGSLSFAYVYLYELINLIGAANAQDAYEKLVAFGSAYRGYDARFGQLFDSWANDFVIYYGLDSSLLTNTFVKSDEAFDVVLNHDASSPEALFDALCQLSSYDIRQSPFFLEHDEELRALALHAFQTAAKHHESLTTTLPAKLSGKLGKQRIWMFERAVFANPLGVESASYAISPHDTVFCRNGAWFRVRYAALEQPIPWVSQLLETCECILRELYQYPNTLEESLKTKYLVKAVRSYAQQLVTEKAEREARAVHIDFSQLEGIRSAADETCEKLIVEEQPELTVFDKATSACRAEVKGASRKDREAGCRGATIEARHVVVATNENDVNTELPDVPAEEVTSTLLDPQERDLLAHLLAGGSAHDFEREHACIASVLIDSINEKLYDEFADICIDTASGTPEVIEDYADELRTIVSMN